MSIRLPISLCSAAFLLALLSGCAGISRVPLDKATSAKLTTVEARLGVPSEEIIVRAAPSKISAATGGGLIPALIDASISKSRQTEIEAMAGKFYEQVDALDFRELFGESFKTSLGTPQTLPNLKVAVSSRGINKDELEQRRNAMKPGEAFLGMRMWYEFTPDARSILVAANVQMITKDKVEPAYTNSFLFLSDPITLEPGTNSNPYDVWAKNQGKALEAAYRESGKEIARMLQMDIAGPSNEALTAENAKMPKAKATIPFYGPFLMAPNGALVALSTDGFLVEKNNQRQIVRAAGGALYSVPQN